MGNKQPRPSGLSSSLPSDYKLPDMRRCRSESFRGFRTSRNTSSRSSTKRDQNSPEINLPSTSAREDPKYLQPPKASGIKKSESLRDPRVKPTVQRFREKRNAVSRGSSGKSSPRVGFNLPPSSPQPIITGLVVQKMVGPLASFNLQEGCWSPVEKDAKPEASTQVTEAKEQPGDVGPENTPTDPLKLHPLKSSFSAPEQTFLTSLESCPAAGGIADEAKTAGEEPRPELIKGEEDKPTKAQQAIEPDAGPTNPLESAGGNSNNPVECIASAAASPSIASSSLAPNPSVRSRSGLPDPVAGRASGTGETLLPDPSSNDSLHGSFSTSELRRRSLQERRLTNAAIASRMSFGKKKKATVLQFTPAQMNAVRAIWNAMKTTKGLIMIGSSIFHRLEFKAPIVKECFKGIPLASLGDGNFQSQDAFAKHHANGISECLDRIIKSLENVEATTEYLENVGAMHARLHEYGFNQKFFNIFAEALIDCTLEWGDKSQRKDDTRRAWAMIASFLVEKLKYGFTEEKRRLYFLTPGSLAPPMRGSSNRSSKSPTTPTVPEVPTQSDPSVSNAATHSGAVASSS